MYHKNKQKFKQPQTRQVIISSMLDEARMDVIRADIEMGFARQVQSKLSNGTLQLSDFSQFGPGGIDNYVKMVEDHYTICLDKLNYLKGLRCVSDAPKNVRGTPKDIQVVLNQK